MSEIDVIIWDEISMTNVTTFDYVHNVMVAVSAMNDKNKPFGGRIVLLGGDWQQILPVVLGVHDNMHVFFSLALSLSLYTLSRARALPCNAGQTRAPSVVFMAEVLTVYFTRRQSPPIKEARPRLPGLLACASARGSEQGPSPPWLSAREHGALAADARRAVLAHH